MNWSDVAEVEELSGPEFTHHADSTVISTPVGGFFSVYAECLEAVLGFIFHFRPQLLAVTPDADTNTDIWNTKQIQRVSL